MMGGNSNKAGYRDTERAKLRIIVYYYGSYRQLGLVKICDFRFYSYL